jgi:hypothetical protein
VIRVITKSHPWGYQLKDNKKPLDTTSKYDAMDFWKPAEVFKDPIENFYPWDPGYAPLPLNIFIQAALEDRSVDDLANDLIDWANKVKPDSKPKVTKETIRYWLYYIYYAEAQSSEPSDPTYSMDHEGRQGQ